MLKSVEVEAVVIASDVMTDDVKPVTAVGVDSATEVNALFDELVIDTVPGVDIVLSVWSGRSLMFEDTDDDS